MEALFLLRWFDTRLAIYSVSKLSVTRPRVLKCVPPSEEMLTRGGCFASGRKRHDSVEKN